MAGGAAFELLRPALDRGHALLVADENLGAIDFTALPRSTVVISNRFDIAAAAAAAGLASHFNDFDFSVIAPPGIARICHRIAKEKPVTHHVINQARALLRAGGELVLAGARQEGLRTYAEKAAAYFAGPAQIHKHGAWYRARIERSADIAAAPLDDSDYTRLRPIAQLYGRTIHSKPGLFGWDKLDAGSRCLVAALATMLRAEPHWQSTTLLDLGCGYGHLALAAYALGVARIVATDNCAAAVQACQRNFAEFDIAGEVVAADCASGLSRRFDLIVCNPPFHRGFAGDFALTARFISAAAGLLTTHGRALFVAHRGVPLERLARQCALGTEVIATDAGFRVVLLSRPARSASGPDRNQPLPPNKAQRRG